MAYIRRDQWPREHRWTTLLKQTPPIQMTKAQSPAGGDSETSPTPKLVNSRVLLPMPLPRVEIRHVAASQRVSSVPVEVDCASLNNLVRPGGTISRLDSVREWKWIRRVATVIEHWHSTEPHKTLRKLRRHRRTSSRFAPSVSTASLYDSIQEWKRQIFADETAVDQESRTRPRGPLICTNPSQQLGVRRVAKYSDNRRHGRATFVEFLADLEPVAMEDDISDRISRAETFLDHDLVDSLDIDETDTSSPYQRWFEDESDNETLSEETTSIISSSPPQPDPRASAPTATIDEHGLQNIDTPEGLPAAVDLDIPRDRMGTLFNELQNVFDEALRQPEELVDHDPVRHGAHAATGAQVRPWTKVETHVTGIKATVEFSWTNMLQTST